MLAYTYEIIRENDRLPAHFSIAHAAPSTIPAHWHDYLEIVYILSGKMTAVIQAESYELTPGDILITNSGDIHMTQVWEEMNDYILLQISAKQLKTFFPDFHLLRFDTWIPAADSNLLTAPEKGPQLTDSILQLPPPAYYIEEMRTIFEEKEDGYPLLFSAKLHELLFCLYRSHSHWNTAGLPVSSDRNFPRIIQCIDWIHAHYTDPLSLDQAALHLNLSREYFCRIFKKYTGQTFLEYVNAVRAEKLYKDLLTDHASITELMEKHGITNYRVFLAAFRKLYGDTPQRIRSREKQGHFPY